MSEQANAVGGPALGAPAGPGGSETQAEFAKKQRAASPVTQAQLAAIPGVGRKTIAAVKSVAPDWIIGPDSGRFPSPSDVVAALQAHTGSKVHASIAAGIGRIYKHLERKPIPGPTTDHRPIPLPRTAITQPTHGTDEFSQQGGPARAWLVNNDTGSIREVWYTAGRGASHALCRIQE